MQHSDSFERHGRRPRPPFRHSRNRHPGLAERDPPKHPPKPKGEIPPEFVDNVFGRVHPMLQHAVAEVGYLTPTPIQEKAIPHLLEGRDLLGCAQTGTGKTAAFLLPILHRLAETPKPTERGEPRALILAPTRELAAQIADSTASYGMFLGLPFAVVFGGVSQYPQVKALNNGAVLVVATPGRLLDLMEQGQLTLSHIEEFVLDEADRMLDMGFLPDIKRILAKLPEQRHTQFFSATLSPEVMRLAMSMVKDPITITISPDQPTVDKINQQLMFVDKPNKIALLADLLSNRPEMKKTLVFARTRHGSDKIVAKLEDAGIRADAIHSDKTQRARTNTLNGFRTGRVRVLVATDIASRGIDVDGITHVINFDLPEETESYVHRIGRTARAGAEGAAIAFVSAEERGLLRAIERMIRKSIPIDKEHAFHSERAERAAGKGAPDGQPPPPWQKQRQERTERRPDTRSASRQRPPSHKGRAQPDFKRPMDDKPGLPPWEQPEKSSERLPARHDAPSRPRRERETPAPRQDAPPPPRRERKTPAPRQDAPSPLRRERETPAPREDSVKNWYDEPFKKHTPRPAAPAIERNRPADDRPRSDDREQSPRFGETATDRPRRPFQPHPGDNRKPGTAKGPGHAGGVQKGFKKSFKKPGPPVQRSPRPPRAASR